MSDATGKPGVDADGEPAANGLKEARTLTPAAQRALAEAEERRRTARQSTHRSAPPTEVGGRDGPDPVRFGDWEKGGIASDF